MKSPEKGFLAIKNRDIIIKWLYYISIWIIICLTISTIINTGLITVGLYDSHSLIRKIVFSSCALICLGGAWSLADEVIEETNIVHKKSEK